MSYTKWVANSNPGDGASHLIRKDGTELRMGEPVQLSADLRKELEGEGRIFEDSSAEEAKKAAEDAEQPAGGDVKGTSPTFVNAGESNQTDQPEKGSK